MKTLLLLLTLASASRYVYVCESDGEIVPAGRVSHGRHLERADNGRYILGGWVHLMRLSDYNRLKGPYASKGR